MILNKKILVVIPAYNEERWIEKTVSTVPKFVDLIVVVDDGSVDKTVESIPKNEKVKIIKHPYNQGVGAAIISGYRYGIDNNFDLIAVMAGDFQMTPEELEPMSRFMIENRVDYIKGNRFAKKDTFAKMPFLRFTGSYFLSFLTEKVTGLKNIRDPQSGYTIITTDILKKIELNQVFPRYGYPNDLLGKLSIVNAKIAEFPISANYNGQSSGIEPLKVILPYSYLLYRIYKERKEKIK
ncbi:glycosyltransferase family 2 protein [bacterium]|nr:glycosyltransferase family 2 protein [bacterium]